MAPKYQFIADSLRREIEEGRYDGGERLPTEQLLCQRYQISRQTVRRALSVLEGEGLIDRRQGSGSRLREPAAPKPLPPRCSIAVVTTYISDYIFPSILRGMERVLTANGSAPLLFATQNQISTERKILHTLLAMRDLDGVLVEGSKTALPNPNLDLYQKLLDQGVRLVFFNGTYPELSSCPSVLADDFGGGKQLVTYLYGKGHRNIAGISRHCGSWTFLWRTSRPVGTIPRPVSPFGLKLLWILSWRTFGAAPPLCAITTRWPSGSSST